VDDPSTRAVIEHATLQRPLPAVRLIGPAERVDWLLDHPTLAATLARHLHPPLEQYQITDRGNGHFDVDDLGALRGHFHLVARAPDRRVYLCQGNFRSLGRLLSLSGGMVFTLEYREAPDGTGRQTVVTPRLYLRLDNVLAHGLLKLLSPLIHGTIDRRAANLATAAQVVAERLVRDPRGLYREMQTWPDARPEDLETFRRTLVSEEASR
jgi:hypothetical protein